MPNANPSLDDLPVSSGDEGPLGGDAALDQTAVLAEGGDRPPMPKKRAKAKAGDDEAEDDKGEGDDEEGDDEEGDDEEGDAKARAWPKAKGKTPVKANAEVDPTAMTGRKPKRYATSTGSDRCDTCFFRADDGRSCGKHMFDVGMGYVPSGRCEDYQPRSMASWFGQKLEGVEVFRVGTWNGEKYTGKDLDALVDAFARVGYRPPVTLGHGADPDAPAYGWVTNLRRDGDVLVADFEDVPDDLVEQIKDGRYDAVSSEIFINLKRNGETFPKALRAVAILGAHPPGVSDLKPLRSVLTHSEGAEIRSIVVTPREDEGMTKPNAAPATDPGAANAVALSEAQARIAQLSEKLAALQQADTGDAALRLQRLQEQNDALMREFAAMREQRRKEKIDEAVAKCRVPALRAHLRALAEFATAEDGESRTVLFQTRADDKPIPTNALAVIVDLITRINDRGELLFGEVAKTGGVRPGSSVDIAEDPGAELFAQANRLAREKGLSFAEARDRVMADPDNAELVRRYNEGGV